MTVAHHVPALRAPSLISALGALRMRGLRISAARRQVLEALYAAGVPITAEEIAAGVPGAVPASDLASVYRNLDVLERAGLVRHMHLGHGPGLYAPAGDDTEYVVCERCGRSLPLPAAALESVRTAVRVAVGYCASFAHFPLTGLCPACEVKLHVRTR